MTIKIICADCKEEMAKMEANSIDAIVTDPPYGLELMGKEWDKLRTERPAKIRNREAGDKSYCAEPRPCYVAGEPAQEWHHDWAMQAIRIAKPGAHLLAFGGTRTFHRLTCAVEDAGWEIRDCLMWVYGSGFPKSLDIAKAIDKKEGVWRGRAGKPLEHDTKRSMGQHYERNKKGDEGDAATPAAQAWQGWGTALKPAWEPIILARKPIESTVAQNVLKWGTGGINIDASRVETDEIFTCWANKINASHQGRFPANLIHDGSDEVVGMFPDSEVRGAAKIGGGRYNQQGSVGGMFGVSGGNPADWPNDSGSAARFFYTAKASKDERDMGCVGMDEQQQDESRKEGNPGGDNPRNRGVHMRRNFHPTVKPLSLMEYLVKLVTPPKGTVLDPFMGSGTTGLACKRHGFNFIGMDISPEYCGIARKRLGGIPTRLDAILKAEEAIA